jgi:hypothetical protein
MELFLNTYIALIYTLLNNNSYKAYKLVKVLFYKILYIGVENGHSNKST